MERYHSPGYRDEKRKLAEWLSLPSDKEMGGDGLGFRDPPTLTALADKLGVSNEVLSRWQREPGFIALKTAIKKKTTLDFEDEFLHKMTLALLKPGSNYDRVFMVWERYVKPSLQNEKDQGDWDQFLPQNDNDSQKMRSAHARMLMELRTLPIEQREMFINILDKVIQAEQFEQQGINPDDFSPRRVLSGEEKFITPPVDNVIPMRELPAPADQVPRYNPNRGLRKDKPPKPRD